MSCDGRALKGRWESPRAALVNSDTNWANSFLREKFSELERGRGGVWDATQVLLDAEIASAGAQSAGGKLTRGGWDAVLAAVRDLLVLLGTIGNVWGV